MTWSLLRLPKTRSAGLFALRLTIIALSFAPPVTFGQVAAYTVVEVSGAADADQIPLALNNLGDVVGRTVDSLPAETHATIWNRGSLHRRKLSKQLGSDYSSAFSINDIGEVTGASNSDNSIVPVVWNPQGGMQRVPLVRGDNGGQAFGINRYGQVVGYSSGPRGKRAFLWTRRTGVRDLGVLPGGDSSRARDVNDAGEVVGTSASNAGNRAVLWTKTGNVRDLGTLPGDGSSEATAINNAGDVVGYSNGPRGPRAFLWTKASGMHDLGYLPGGDSSRALDINDAGDVVGTSTSLSGDRAFIWTGEAGMNDLNAAVSADLPVECVEAQAINSNGQILVRGKIAQPLGMSSETAAVENQANLEGPSHICAPAPASTFLLTPN